MNKTFTSIKTLTIASMRMYFRNRGAVIFTLILPLALLSVFGFLSKSNNAAITVELTNNSNTEIAKSLVKSIQDIKAFKVKEVSQSEAADALGKGNADLQVIIPEQFGTMDDKGALVNAAITTHYNAAKPQNGQAANLIITQVVNGFNNQLTHAPQPLTIESSGVQTNNLNYFDFILPGILAMTIMQLGIFGVSFAFVSLKASGALRRLQATPVHPRNFVFAQAVTRLVITLATVALLLVLGIKFFNFHMIGSYASFGLITVLGILVFLGIGFGVAGWAKDENQVAPVANVIQLPMLFLSGIFFPRDSFPNWLHTVTNFFPLTYLSDALHKIANEGVHLSALGGDLLGLVIWGVIIYILAINLFRWE